MLIGVMADTHDNLRMLAAALRVFREHGVEAILHAGDFDGWVQERGLNFPSKWSKEWRPLLQMNDTGDKPLKGALLYARHGKGDYIYCSLALYRQLRGGHVGTARILVNLLTR